MSACEDNQEVGSEAAILERVRNSSLVECAGAENVTGLKRHTEAVDTRRKARMVGERSSASEARPEGRVEELEVRMPV